MIDDIRPGSSCRYVKRIWITGIGSIDWTASTTGFPRIHLPCLVRTSGICAAATALGIPMYADIFGALPIRGSGTPGSGGGTVLAFMMAVVRHPLLSGWLIL